MKYLIGACGLLIAITIALGSYLLGVKHETSVYAAQLPSVKQTAKKQQAAADKNAQEGSLTSLRVCINYATTADQQTSCFRKAAQGTLDEPTIEDLNKLPDLN